MAYGDPLPNEDRVLRGCSRGCDRGEVTASAFEMRKQERNLLRISVDWVECPYASRMEQSLQGSIDRMKSGPIVAPPYAILGVSEIRKKQRGSWMLDAKEFGSDSNPCHSGITGFSGFQSTDLELQDDLAQVANLSPIIEPPTG